MNRDSMVGLLALAAGAVFVSGCATTDRNRAYDISADYLPAQSLVSRQAPDFQARAVNADDEIVSVTLKDLFDGRRYLLLVFYPGDFTFVCPLELKELSQNKEEFSSRDCALAGISVDSAEVHLAWRLARPEDGGVGKLTFPLIADRSGTITRDYGVAGENSGALRAWFIIDSETGRVRHQLVNESAHGRNVAEVLRMLDAIRFTESQAGVCPEGWTPGEETLDPSREGLLQYLLANLNSR